MFTNIFYLGLDEKIYIEQYTPQMRSHPSLLNAYVHWGAPKTT